LTPNFKLLFSSTTKTKKMFAKMQRLLPSARQ
jgi:hypothetical protein